MAYFWLNQKDSDGSNYQDEVGKVYHYRGNTAGASQLSEGDEFVYYRPGDYEIFGAGEIDRIEKRGKNPETDSGIGVEYFAHISSYRLFDPPLRLKGVNEHDVKDEISFLKDRPGLTGVPQHSIHQISKEDFTAIITAAEKEVGPTGKRE